MRQLWRRDGSRLSTSSQFTNDIAITTVELYDSFERRIRELFPALGGELATALTKLASPRVLPKGHIVEEPGTTPARLYFLAEGAAEQYWDEGDRVRASYLWTAGDIVGRLNALLSNRPDQQGIRIVRSAQLLSFSYTSLQQLAEHHPSYPSLALAVLQHYATAVGDLGYVLAQRKPADRFRALRDLHPLWVSDFSQTRLASLLNMRRETLSRLRASHQV